MATIRVQSSGGLAVVGGVSQGSVPSGVLMSSWDLYGPNTQEGLIPQNTAGSYAWSEDALTANTESFPFDQGDWFQALYVHWRVAWLPNATGNGVRLVHADSGPANITEIAAHTGSSSTAPIVSDAVLTTEFNALITAGAWKTLGMQVKSDGTMRVYSSRIDVVWQVSP